MINFKHSSHLLEVPFIKATFKSKVKSFLNVCEGGHLSYSGEP